MKKRRWKQRLYEEKEMAKELVGEPPQQAGLEDLLWGLAMLPEFQLIY